jgi:hypothetical protein
LTLRDFRVSENTLDAFKADFNANLGNYIFAKGGDPVPKGNAVALSVSATVVSFTVLISVLWL